MPSPDSDAAARRRAYQREWYAANRDRIREKNRAYYVAHRDEINARAASYRQANLERIRAYDRRRGKTAKRQCQQAASGENRVQRREVWRRHYEANEERFWERNAFRRYGLTKGDYEVLLEAQGGVCTICGGTGKSRLAVDHDHVTGRIRGLLCSECNTGIGKLREDPEIISRALAYIVVAPPPASARRPTAPVDDPEPSAGRSAAPRASRKPSGQLVMWSSQVQGSEP